MSVTFTVISRSVTKNAANVGTFSSADCVDAPVSKGNSKGTHVTYRTTGSATAASVPTSRLALPHSGVDVA